MLPIRSEVFICEGLHRNANGVLLSIDQTTEIPFAHIQLRGADGQILRTKFALVPLKYCRVVDDECRALIKTIKADAKAARKAKRSADAAAAEEFRHSFVAASAKFLGLDARNAERDAAIERAAKGAGSEWAEAAGSLLHLFAASHERFLTEEVRTFAANEGLDAPRDNRAWGAVTCAAIRAGVIAHDGFGQTRFGPGHRRAMNCWKSLIYKAAP